MNKELVEQITRLVLERMSGYEKQSVYNLPLDEDELLDWSNLHSHKHEGRISSQYSSPLSEEEVKEWAHISQSNSFNSKLVKAKETSGQANMVRFSKVSS